MTRKTPREHLVTAREIADGPELAVSHPLARDRSEVHLRPLGARVGLERTQVSLGRIPPGKEAFTLHSHAADEEWLYVLSGRGRVRIGEETFDVGPGDFVGFPAPSLPHCLANAGAEDLVYLMGGERSRVEVGEFPEAGKHAIFSAGGVLLVDSQHVERMSFEEYLTKR